jgi:hypothetical protein
VKLGSPYPPNPSYIEYFTQSSGGNKLEDSHFYPESLLVISSALEIIVEDVRNTQIQHVGYGNNVHGLVQVNEINEDSQIQASGSIAIGAGHHAPSPSPQDVKLSKSESVIAWLKEKAVLQDDYPLFLGSHHRVLQNADIVSIWRFASNFYKIYYYSKNPITVSSSLEFLHSRCQFEAPSENPDQENNNLCCTRCS